MTHHTYDAQRSGYAPQNRHTHITWNVTTMTIALLLITMAGLALADHITGTAWYQRPKETNMFTDDHFDIFADDDHGDENGSTSDYWDGYAIAFAADEVHILTDAELDALSEDDDQTDADIAAWYDDDPLGAELFFGGIPADDDRYDFVDVYEY